MRASRNWRAQFGKYLEPDELDALHAHRLTFGDANEEIDGGLIVAEFDIERGDPRVGKTAVAVKRHDALDIGLELFAAEIALLAPGDLRTARPVASTDFNCPCRQLSNPRISGC